MTVLHIDGLNGFLSDITWHEGTDVYEVLVTGRTGRMWRGTRLTIGDAVQLAGLIVNEQQCLPPPPAPEVSKSARMAEFRKAIERLAALGRASILIVHHARKGRRSIGGSGK